jgi:hypothetical protein
VVESGGVDFTGGGTSPVGDNVGIAVVAGAAAVAGPAGGPARTSHSTVAGASISGDAVGCDAIAIGGTAGGAELAALAAGDCRRGAAAAASSAAAAAAIPAVAVARNKLAADAASSVGDGGSVRSADSDPAAEEAVAGSGFRCRGGRRDAGAG